MILYLLLSFMIAIILVGQLAGVIERLISLFASLSRLFGKLVALIQRSRNKATHRTINKEATLS